MRVLNFGSLNIDYVYNVDHIVKKGETIKRLLRRKRIKPVDCPEQSGGRSLSCGCNWRRWSVSGRNIKGIRRTYQVCADESRHENRKRDYSEGQEWR